MLLAHKGGWTAQPADLAAVPVPDATESYTPVPYGRLIEEVKLHVPRFSLEVVREDYALARDGNQMFGVLTCRNGTPTTGYGLAIGIRSSYDRSLAVDFAAGARVFVCDNLAFTGEAKASRKHTVNVFRDLPGMIYEMLQSVSAFKARMVQEFEAMKVTSIYEPLAHHLMVAAVRRNVLPASRLPKLIAEWEEPQHEEFKPRNAWSLYNAFTEVAKARSPHDQMDGGLRLTQLFRDVLALGTS